MTNDERQKLVSRLKNYAGYDRELTQLVHDAAGEIEWLTAELDETRKQLTLTQIDRDDWRFGRRYD